MYQWKEEDRSEKLITGCSILALNWKCVNLTRFNYPCDLHQVSQQLVQVYLLISKTKYCIIWIVILLLTILKVICR